MALGECNDGKCGAVDAVRPRGLVALGGDRAPSFLVTKHFPSLMDPAGSLEVGPAAECLLPPHTRVKILRTCTPLLLSCQHGNASPWPHGVL